jgi:hypothetical protein
MTQITARHKKMAEYKKSLFFVIQNLYLKHLSGLAAHLMRQTNNSYRNLI